MEEGLTVLREDGPEAIAADKLAKRLGVSRGSFYWHFKSAAGFESALLAAWEERWTTRLIETVSRSADGPRGRLRLLIQATAGLDADVYSAAKRMARRRPEHAAVMERIDHRRVQFVADILTEGGVPGAAAKVRAQIIYAWAMGQMLTAAPGAQLHEAVLANLLHMAFDNDASAKLA